MLAAGLTILFLVCALIIIVFGVLGILLGTMSDGAYGDWCRYWDDFCDR
jgi:hypothetical protein